MPKVNYKVVDITISSPIAHGNFFQKTVIAVLHNYVMSTIVGYVAEYLLINKFSLEIC